MSKAVNAGFFCFIVLSTMYLRPVPLRAQATELGEITGRVVDQQGGAVANAAVKVVNAGTSVERAINTDNQGVFAARSLVPGVYRVEVSAPSFSTQIQDNIKLDVSATVSVDF